MRTIKLMADYDCFPLWEVSPGEVGNIDPQSLPISRSLQAGLMRWAAEFDAVLNRNDPGSSRFASEANAIAFANAGQELARQMQEELGSAYRIVWKR